MQSNFFFSVYHYKAWWSLPIRHILLEISLEKQITFAFILKMFASFLVTFILISHSIYERNGVLVFFLPSSFLFGISFSSGYFFLKNMAFSGHVNVMFVLIVYILLLVHLLILFFTFIQFIQSSIVVFLFKFWSLCWVLILQNFLLNN